MNFCILFRLIDNNLAAVSTTANFSRPLTASLKQADKSIVFCIAVHYKVGRTFDYDYTFVLGVTGH